MSREQQSRSLPPALVGKLRKALGEDAVLTQPGRILPYETDATALCRGRPELVLLPEEASQATEAVKILHEAELPWLPRGAGTGLSGGAVAASGGAILSLAKLRRTLRLEPSRRRARVEPGVVNLALNESLRRYGLQFAPDPTSQIAATIGGNIAENAGGPHTLKYGAAAQHVLGLRVVLGDGSVLELGGEEETAAGYDLVGLLVGSEGTLGLVAEATLRLVPLPEETRTFMAIFGSTSDASRAVGAVLREGIVPAVLEMIDSVVLDALEEAFGVGFPLGAGALLIGEVDGLEGSAEAQMQIVERVLQSSGAREVRLAQSDEERERLWSARKLAFRALGRVSPNYISHDTAVPRSALPEVLRRIGALGERMKLRIANIFHAGDGNLHPTILFDESDAELFGRAKEAGQRILQICLEAGGVLTGQHGIGLLKREEMRWAFTTEEIRLMHGLRRAFDPWGRVNPGKLLPPLSQDSRPDDIDSDGVGRARVAGDDRAAPLSEGEPEGSFRGGIAPRRRHRQSPAEARLHEAIHEAARTRERLAPVGGGTLLVAPIPGASDGPGPAVDGSTKATDPRILETWVADRILQYNPVDFAITLEAGVSLEAARQALRPERQRLAWEAPNPEMATLGGIVAAGYWSSLTFGLGHPKHSLLGFRAITGDGEMIEFGGAVVKNVSGYDLGKLLVGSRGTLAVLTRLTLRTYPCPHRPAVAVARGGFGALLDLASELAALPLGWSLIDLVTGPEGTFLLVGLDGNRQEVDRRWRELQAAGRRLGSRVSGPEGAAGSRVSGPEGAAGSRVGGPKAAAGSRVSGPKAAADLRKAEGEEALALQRGAADALHWSESALILRLVTPAAKIADLATRVEGLCAAGGAGGWTHRIQCHPGIGLLRVSFEFGYEEIQLRRLLLDVAEVAREIGGHRGLDRAPAHPWWGWDAWGVPPLLRERMRQIQTIFDSRGVLRHWTPEGRARG